MVIETRNNTDACALSTPIRAMSVFAKKRRRRYRRRMEHNPTDAFLHDISGAAIKSAREKAGFISRPQFGNTFRPPILAETIRKIEEYIPGVDNKDDIKASPTKWRICIRLGLLPSPVNDMTKRSQEPVKQDARGEHLDLYEPRLTAGGYMSVATGTAKSTTARPPYIDGQSAWAMKMVGDTMWPEYRNGATLYVDPDIAPEIDRGCVFLNPDRTQFRVLAYLGETADTWEARVWNPPPDSRPTEVLRRAEWPFCEVIDAASGPKGRLRK